METEEKSGERKEESREREKKSGGGEEEEGEWRIVYGQKYCFWMR